MTHEELGQLLTKQTTPEFDAMPVNKKMTNDQRSAAICLVVECMAYRLLLDCELPSKVHDGYSYYIKENWELNFQDLFLATVDRLKDKGWEWEEGDNTDDVVEFFCCHFLDSEEYEDRVDEIRKEYYEGKHERFLTIKKKRI